MEQVFPLFNSPQLTYVLADCLLIVKCTGACTFSERIGLDDIRLCLSFFNLTLIAGSVVRGIHSLESLACQIWKEAFKEARLKDFKMGRTNLPGNPRPRRQGFSEMLSSIP